MGKISMVKALLLAGLLAGCSSGDTGTREADAFDGEDGGADPADESDGGPLTGPGEKPGKPGRPGIGPDSSDAGVEVAQDGGNTVTDGGTGTPDASGPKMCLDGAWKLKDAQCCWQGWQTEPSVAALAVAGQASGSFTVDMSNGYGALLLDYPAASTESVQLKMVLTDTFSNATFSKYVIVKGGLKRHFTVEPTDICDDTLPAGKTLHFTYTVQYL